MKHILIVVALSMIGCGYESPTQPSPPPVQATPEPVPAPPLVLPPPAPFVLTLTVGPTSPMAGDRAAFSAIVMQGQAVAPVSYVWTFGDGTGTQSSSNIVFHAYSHDGPYDASVTATDAEQVSSTARQFVDVRERPAVPPPPPPSPPPPPPEPPPPPPPPPPPALSIALSCTAGLFPAPTACNLSASYGGAALPLRANLRVRMQRIRQDRVLRDAIAPIPRDACDRR